MSVLVSINCITYNHEEYIADAIEGFLSQKTDFEYEILIGEDCSTDNTKRIVEQYIAKYPELIKLVTSEENVGAAKNADRILELSKGKYIAICEGDDYWTDPYKLQKQVGYLEKNPRCTMCFHEADIVKVPKKSTGMKIKPYKRDQVSPMEDIIIGGGGFCPTASLVYPKSVMQDFPDYLRTSHVGDYPLQLLLTSSGYAYYMNECMSAYRVGVKGSWTTRLNSSSDLKERMMVVNEGDIQILTAFNRYTNFKYNDSVERVIHEKRYAIYIGSGITNEPKNNRYEEHVKSLSIKRKAKLIAFNSFPKSYGMLAQMKNYFLNIKLFN
ncbi:glycosyltransferase [Sporosarcina sp.]|uniref:glycosyltransferase n=1 Tax=Sporosarcina sp. TaxID=49982 RepID=UPI0026152E9D|nr:glycosyltransferase [Sporosarcina sp.]